MSYELTSPRIIQDDIKAARAGLCLKVEDSRLIAIARSGCVEGLSAKAEVVCKQEGFASHVLYIPFEHGRADLTPVEGPRAWRLLELAEKALWSAELNAWDKVGEMVDAIWAQDRADLPPNPKLDLAYSAGRLAGAYGGRPVEGGFVFLAPPTSHAAIREVIK